MNLPKISFSKPSFSPRFFIYFLFTLVVLVLLVEGGYYWWRIKEKIIPPKEIKTMVEDVEKNPITEPARLGSMFTSGIVNGETRLFVEGLVVEVNNSIFTLEKDDKQIKVKIDPNVEVHLSVLKEGKHSVFRGIEALREEINLGDTIAAGALSFDSQEDIPVASVVLIPKR